MTKSDRELDLMEREVIVKEKEGRRMRPFLVAVIVASIGLVGNGFLAYLGQRHESQLARINAQSEFILQALKAGKEDQITANLRFLVKNKLVTENDLLVSLNTFLKDKPESNLSPRILSNVIDSSFLPSTDRVAEVMNLLEDAREARRQQVGN